MNDPTSILKQMMRRSTRILWSPKNLAKGTWLDMDDFEVRQRVRDEMEELAQAIGLTWKDGYLDPIFKVDWEYTANEGADVHHFTEFGADPRRIARHVT